MHITKGTTAVAVGAALGATVLASSASSAGVLPEFDVSVFMTDLSNPRGLTFNGDTLYVAEAGVGGDVLVSDDGTAQTYYGTTGRISSRSFDGMQDVYLDGLPSLAGPGGAEATGPQDVAFGPDGALHAVLGLGANPAIRQESPLANQALGSWLGSVIRQNEDFSVSRVLDVALFEALVNPDDGVVDSNPYSLAFAPGDESGQFVVSDAGGNSLLIADGVGWVAGSIVLPPQPNPLPFGPPFYEAVPTGIAYAPDALSLYVAQLTGFPFPEGGAQVLRYGGPEGPEVVAEGLTNLIDVAVASDGTVYALSLDLDGLVNPGTNGGIFRLNGDGTSDLIVDDLVTPTGLTVGPDGALYVTNFGLSSDSGQVLRVAIPEPTSLVTLIASGGLLLCRRRR